MRGLNYGSIEADYTAYTHGPTVLFCFGGPGTYISGYNTRAVVACGCFSDSALQPLQLARCCLTCCGVACFCEPAIR